MVQVIIVAPASIIRAGVHAILSRAPNAALSGVTGDLTVARRWMRSTAGRPHAGVDRIGSESADPHPLLLAHGQDTVAIATLLGMSRKTVEYHTGRLLAKLEMKTRLNIAL